MSETVAYSASRIFNGDHWLSDHAIVVSEKDIVDLIKITDVQGTGTIKSFDGCIIAPAFIDLQIYGASGRLLALYPDKETVKQIVDYSNKGGAAHCLPAVATNTKDVFYRSIDAIKDYWNSGGEGALGLHIEGPWINPEKRGAHIKSLIHSPTKKEVEDLLQYGKGVIKMITLAPEVCSKEIIDLILSENIIISAGHSNASYQEAMNSFENGIRSVTHLYNAMSGFHHREPGLMGAAMDHGSVMASIIPDGHHVDYAAIRIAKKIIKERLFAITDAVTGTTEGYYQHSLAGDKYEAGGILSGSALTMLTALKNLVQHVGIETGEALRMCSLYPSRLMGLTELGEIKTGSKCKLVLIDKDLRFARLI